MVYYTEMWSGVPMKKYLFIVVCLLLMSVYLCGAVMPQHKEKVDTMSEINKLRNNLNSLLCRQYSALAGDTSTLLRQLLPDGSIAGMNYHQENVRGSAWAPAKHLSAMQQLAPSHPEVAARMLDFWLRTDATSKNWWWPQIGIPAAVCRTMLMLGRKAEKRDRQLEALLNRSQMGRTGQNKVWLAGIHLMKGLLYGDPAMVKAGREAILSEICVTDKEGLQADWSFHQHGAQLQFGNYGLSWFGDMAFWAAALAGTSYALPPEKLTLITKYYEHGLRWTLYNNMMDISACGRQIIESWPQKKFIQICSYADLLKKSGLLKELPAPRGSICYPESGYLIHRNEDFFFSVKMSSATLIGSEVVNSENALGRYSADGAAMLYTRYPWHQSSLALRNWHKVPGTTELQNSDSLRPTREYPHENSSSYCCFAEGTVAAAMMRFRVSRLQADKAWFCFDKYIVCMGTNIKSFEPGSVATTLVQRFRNTQVLLGNKPLTDGEFCSAGKTSFTFEGMRYLLPESGSFKFLLDHRQGNWNTINLEHPSSPVSGDMLTIWQEHDTSAPGQYLYVIHPENIPAPEIKYLRGNNIIGIHTPDGIIAAFFSPGKLLDIETAVPGLYIDFKNIQKFIPLGE